MIGLLNSSDPQGPRLAIVFGLVLASLAGGLETAARDHFTGFRSHTSLLAAMPTVLLAAILIFALLDVQAPIILPVAVVVYAIAFFYLRQRIQAPHRSGGLNF